MQRPIELVAPFLDDARETGSDRARGRYGDHDVEIRFVDRGAGSTRDPHTEIWLLDAAKRSDLRLHVIPQREADVAEVEHGRGTDVWMNDRPFDAAFFVEAAPADVLVHLFDRGIRETMRGLRPLSIHTHGEGLCLEQAGWIDDASTLAELVSLGARIVDRIPEAFEAADRAAQSRTGYRTAVTSSELTEERRAEVASVLAKKKAREAHRERTTLIFVGLMTLAICVVCTIAVVYCGEQGESGIESEP